MVFGVIVVATVLMVTVAREELLSAKTEEFKEESVYLYFNLEVVTEQSFALPAYAALAENLGIRLPQITSIGDLKDILIVAEKDKRVKGIFLDTDRSNFETTSIAQELGEALAHYKKVTGNPIYGYSVAFGWEDFLAMQPADRKFAVNASGLNKEGFQVNSFFLKDFYTNYGVKDYSYKVGKYSLENLESQAGFNQDNQKSIDELVWKSTDELIGIMNKTNGSQLTRNDFELSTFTKLENEFKSEAQIMLDYKLVTDVVSNFKWADFVRETAGVNKETKRPLIVTYRQYQSDMAARDALKTDESKDYYLTYYYGGVLSEDDINAQDIVDELFSITVDVDQEKVAEEEKATGQKFGKLKGIVLRLNSGGGDATQADILYRGIEKIRASGTPVVVSVSDVLGGATYAGVQSADAIVANNLALLGSLEAHHKFVDVTDTLRAFYNINPSYFRATNLVVSSTQVPFPFNMVLKGAPNLTLVGPEYVQMRNLMTEATYDNLVAKLAEGRKLTKEQAQALAQGQVYNATTAKELKLIDAVGGVNEAYAQLDRLNKEKDEKFDPAVIEKFEGNPERGRYSSVLSSLNSILSKYEAYKVRQEQNLSLNAYKLMKFEAVNTNQNKVLSLCSACYTAPNGGNLKPKSDLKGVDSFYMDLLGR